MTICPVCHTPAELYYRLCRACRAGGWRLCKHGHGVFHMRCKPCAVARTRAWQLRNPERVRAARNEWRRKNKDRLYIIQRRWYLSHKDAVHAKQRAYFRADPTRGQQKYQRRKMRRAAHDNA